jgi:hypothetical protein
MSDIPLRRMERWRRFKPKHVVRHRTNVVRSACGEKRRKVSMIGSYIARGQTIEEATMTPTVVNHLNTVAVAAAAAPNLRPLPPPPPGPSPFQDPNRGAPKLYQCNREFLGFAHGFRSMGKEDTSTPREQTSYEGLMTASRDPVSQKRNRELCHMFMTAIMDGSGLHIINGIAEPDGHAAWTRSVIGTIWLLQAG